jgi:hypothetical protein
MDASHIPSILALIGILLTPTAVFLTVLWRQERRRAQRAERLLEKIAPRSVAEMGATDHARLERIEQALETLGEEFERLAEGQRFTAQLLSERGERKGSLRDAERPSGSVTST